MLYDAGHVLQSAGLGDDLQVGDTPTDGDFPLSSEDDAGERDAGTLAASRLGEEILVLAEENPTEVGGPVEKGGIRYAARAIFLSREHINVAGAEPSRDGCRHVHVHVQRDAHPTRPIFRRRLSKGVSPASARRRSTSRSSSSI